MPQKRPREYTGLSSFLEKAASYPEFVTLHAAPPSRRQVKRAALIEKRKEIWKQKLVARSEASQETQMEATAEEKLPPKMEPSRTLLVGRLDYDVSENDLISKLSCFGTVKQCSIVRHQGISRGYGFVEFASVDEAKVAHAYADGKLIGTRRIVVDWQRGGNDPSWVPSHLGGGLGRARAYDPWRKPGRPPAQGAFASDVGVKRLMHDFSLLQRSPLPGIAAAPINLI